MKPYFDREEIWESIRKFMPVGATAASIFFDALSLWLALRSNFGMAIIMASLSTIVIIALIWYLIERYGISSFDLEYVIESIRDEFFFESSHKSIYRREMVLRVKKELKALTYFLTASGHGTELGFQVSEKRHGRFEKEKWKQLKLIRQRIAGREALIISREVPFVPDERYTIAIESQLSNAFPNCYSEGFGMYLPPLLREYRLKMVIPADYFEKPQEMPPILQWFKVYRERVFPLDQDIVRGHVRGEYVEFFVDLSKKLNGRLSTEFNFVWEWKLPSEECKSRESRDTGAT